jgi:CxxC motif-containing protein
MAETTELICVTCPVGCKLEVASDGDTIVEIAGNICKRGEAYAEAELFDPRRMLATTVQVAGGVHPLVPVYTAAPIPKPLIFDLLVELRQIELRAPVRAGQVVLEDALGAGVTVLTSRDLPAATG